MGNGDIIMRSGGTVVHGVSKHDSTVAVCDGITASDNLKISHDALASTGSTSFVKLKTITFSRALSGTVRVKFTLYGDGASATPHGRIYKNEVAVGADQSMTGQTPTEKSEDLTITLAIGDTLELWGAVNTTYTCIVTNFRLYFDYSWSFGTISSNS